MYARHVDVSSLSEIIPLLDLSCAAAYKLVIRYSCLVLSCKYQTDEEEQKVREDEEEMREDEDHHHYKTPNPQGIQAMAHIKGKP